MLPLLLAAVTIHTNFEGGSLGRVEQVSETYFRCAVKGQADQEGRNRQANWYYFRLDGAGGRPVTMDLTELTGEYNYRPANAVTRDTYPVYRSNRVIPSEDPVIPSEARDLLFATANCTADSSLRSE